MTTDVLDAAPPALSPDQAAHVARTRFGVEATATAIVSERDQNFRLTEADGGAWVLKVSNAAEDRGVVDMEVAAVERIARLDPSLPVPLARPALDGSPDRQRRGRRLDPPRPAPAPAARTQRVRDRAGFGDGHANRGGRGAHRRGASRLLPPGGRPADLVGSASTCRSWRGWRHRSRIPPGATLLARTLARFDERVAPALPRLRGQVIHNDVTLDNLLLDERRRVTGIVDFGDMAHTALVLDIPATLQSLVRGRTDLFEVSEAFLAGYASVLPLEAGEAELHGRPACREDGADDPHLRLAHADVPRQRVHPWLGGARLGAPRAAGGDRLRRGGVAHGGDRPSADPATNSVRRAAGPPPPGAWQRARVALLPDAAAPRARRRRLDGGCRRTPLPRRVQQRPGRRPRAPPGRRRHRATGGDAEHEHALSP